MIKIEHEDLYQPFMTTNFQTDIINPKRVLREVEIHLPHPDVKFFETLTILEEKDEMLV